MNICILKSITIIPIVIVSMLTFGCKEGFFSPSIDAARDAEGNVILLDTPKNWNLWVTLIEPDIRAEMSGAGPPGGMQSWNQRWISSIEELEKGRQENYSKYIDYIIKKRKEAGLPPLSYE